MNVYCICFAVMPAPGLSDKTRAPVLPQIFGMKAAPAGIVSLQIGKGKENSIKKLQ